MNRHILVPKQEKLSSRNSKMYSNPETYMGYVLGLRTFRYAFFCPYITGSYGSRWYSPRMKARCKGSMTCSGSPFPAPKTQECPHNGNYRKCGINMWKEKHFQIDSTTFAGRTAGYHATRAALTRGWGKVIEHEKGYRVQQALITHIFIGESGTCISAQNHLHGFRKRGTLFTSNVKQFQEWIAQEQEELVPIPPEELMHDAR